MNKDNCKTCKEHGKVKRIFIANIDNLGNPIEPYFELDLSKMGKRKGDFSATFKLKLK